MGRVCVVLNFFLLEGFEFFVQWLHFLAFCTFAKLSVTPNGHWPCFPSPSPSLRERLHHLHPSQPWVLWILCSKSIFIRLLSLSPCSDESPLISHWDCYHITISCQAMGRSTKLLTNLAYPDKPISSFAYIFLRKLLVLLCFLICG